MRASSWKHALPTPHAPPADFLSRGRTCEWARVRAHAALQPRDRRSARAVHRKRRSRAVTPPPFLSTRPPARPQLALGTQSHRRAGGCGRGWRWTERVAKWRGHAWAAAAMGGRKSNAALSSLTLTTPLLSSHSLMFFEQAREHAERDCEKNPKDTQAREERERREGGRALALLSTSRPTHSPSPFLPLSPGPHPVGRRPPGAGPLLPGRRGVRQDPPGERGGRERERERAERERPLPLSSLQARARTSPLPPFPRTRPRLLPLSPLSPPPAPSRPSPSSRPPWPSTRPSMTPCGAWATRTPLRAS